MLYYINCSFFNKLTKQNTLKNHNIYINVHYITNIMNTNEHILIDNKDKKIINALLDNSKQSYRDLAKKTKLSPVTVMNRVNNLKKNKILKNHSININYELIGYETQALIQIRIAKGKLFEVEKKIATHPNVFAVYDTTGHYDALIITKFKSRKGLDAFLKKIQTYAFVERTETMIILNTLKEKNIKIS